MDELSRLRRKDTTKGPPLRILSLDGGGVRGYSMLILLQELMHRTYVECEGKAPRRDQIPKPADHFDLIAGTGTGGLIAIMLGRLRLDIETCKEVYVRMTRKVFETDKRIAGIPYTSTLFKASKLEEAIRECVREHTIFLDEGNDGTPEGGREFPMTPNTPASAVGGFNSMSNRTSSISSSSGFSPASPRGPIGSRWGNANSYLYDNRENRTKTAVTAVYKGTPKNGSSALLRSYDSRKEPAPEFNCTIWQAGRATSAIGLAFKPIQIGQSVYTDEGAGKYNPAPLILDEAAVNEWPGREVGVFISIGTGKRPSGTNHQQSEWWEGFLGGSLGNFAEAKRRLMMKIEGCEETHQYMRNEHLAKRGVNSDNYYRLNVEVGVGEFGMNEWGRVAEISTNTRQYLAKPEVQKMNLDAAAKMARIELSRRRHTRYTTAGELDGYEKPALPDIPPPSNPMAVELPGDVVLPLKPRPRPGPQYPVNPPHPYEQYSSSQDKFTVISPDQYAQTSGELPYRVSSEQQYRDDNSRYSTSSFAPSPRRSNEGYGRRTPPPLPPKSPIRRFSDGTEEMRQPDGRIQLPYPDTDGPPPVVNFARKPEYPMR